MKRFHVHVTVDDLAQSVRFYSTLFAVEPTVLKPDYAKWMLEDPRVNFAISTGAGHSAGISHLGIQAEDEASWAKFTTGSPRPSAPSSRRRRRPAATRDRTSNGSPIRRACRGKPSTPMASRRFTAIAAC